MRVGLLGAGNISGIMAHTIRGMEGVVCVAVASRDITKAEEFAKKYNIQKAYGSYQEMLKDDEVDLVYVALPHSHHYEAMKECIKYKKPILCEKAFTANAREAREILEMARESGVFVTEAIWTRYIPMRGIIQEIIDGGDIGKPAMLSANLGYVIHEKERIREPELAGGALLDLGVYPINFAFMVFGTDIVSAGSSVQKMDTGVDEAESITLHYADGRVAVLHATVMAMTDRMGIVSGDKGYLIVDNINNPERVRVYDLDRNKIKDIMAPKQITGYEYEVYACKRALDHNQLACEEMPHEDTLQVMSFMDNLRSEWGVVYPCDSK